MMRKPDQPLSFESIAVHAGREQFAELGVHAPPIDLSSTYPLHDLAEATADLDALVGGANHAHGSVYARLHNPTVARFEDALARLETAEAAVAFSSGMAAMTACLLAASRHGRHIVAVRPLYGTSDHLLDSPLLGLRVSWTTADRIADALQPDTSLVIIETPGNPTLAMVDIAAVVAQAKGVPVLVDSTFATPVLQRPLELGATLVLHSATKFIGGHGDVIAGVIACNEDWAHELRQVRVLTGALLHPLAAYLLHRGLQTLSLRVRASQSGAQVLAQRLADHPAVAAVRYPGLPGGDPAGLIGRQMQGPGGILAFDLRGGHDAAAALMSALRLITPAVSLGSVDSLIQHPAGLTHRVMDPYARAAVGIGDGMLRLSVGLEDPDDLWRDLQQGLAAAERSKAVASGLARAV